MACNKTQDSFMKFKFILPTFLPVLFCLTFKHAIALYQPISIGKADSIRIRIFYDHAQPADTLSLFYYENLLQNDPLPGVDKFMRQEAMMQKDGSFQFSFLPTTKLGYVSIGQKSSKGHWASFNYLLYDVLAERKDNVTIYITYPPPKNKRDTAVFLIENLKYRFSGISAKQYILKSQIDSVMYYTTGNTGPAFDKHMNYIPQDDHWEKKIRAGLDLLARYKDVFSINLYNQLKTDIFYGERKYHKYFFIKDFYTKWVSKQDSNSIKRFQRAYHEMSENDHLILPEDARFRSKDYAALILYQMECNDLILRGKIDTLHIFNLIKTNYKGEIRDKLMAEYFYIFSINDALTGYKRLLYEALKLVQTRFAREIFLQLKQRIKGSVAYNFHLPDTNKKEIHLGDFKGKIVFIDFWFTGCGSCSAYYTRELSKAEAYFKKDIDVAFISVSVDTGFEHWKKSVNGGLYTSPDIVNLYTGGRGIYDPVTKYYSIASFPHPMLIDKKGRVIKFADASLRYSSSIIQAIKAAKESM
jgi:thiol-disulfide isomerase/thioredoxin